MSKRAGAVGLAVLVLCLAVSGASGCGRAARAPVGAAEVPPIAVLAPGAAEMLDALGLLDRVVAVGDYVDWPPAMRGLPRLGAYDAPNEERVLALGVKVLITSLGKEGASRLSHLESLGVTVLRLDLSTFDGSFGAIEQLGARFDRRDRARAVQSDMRQRLARVERAAAGAPRRRVLFVVGRDPLYVAGAGSHLDRLIQLAGGTNLAADSHAPYELTSFEVVLRRLPEVIVDTSDNRPGSAVGRLLGEWRQWPFLPAVRDRRVYRVDPWRLNIPGPRLPQMAELMGKLIHPEIFGEAAPADLVAPVAASAAPVAASAAPAASAATAAAAAATVTPAGTAASGH
jgi:iron complex transport system substrate-binding protein